MLDIEDCAFPGDFGMCSAANAIAASRKFDSSTILFSRQKRHRGAIANYERPSATFFGAPHKSLAPATIITNYDACFFAFDNQGAVGSRVRHIIGISDVNITLDRYCGAIPHYD